MHYGLLRWLSLIMPGLNLPRNSVIFPTGLFPGFRIVFHLRVVDDHVVVGPKRIVIRSPRSAVKLLSLSVAWGYHHMK